MICGGIYERDISISAALFFVKRLTQGFAGSFLLSTCSSVEFGVVTLASAGKTLIIVSLDLGYLGFFHCRPMISPFSDEKLLCWLRPFSGYIPRTRHFHGDCMWRSCHLYFQICAYSSSYWASTGCNGGLPWSSSSFPLAMAIRPQCTLVIVCWEHSKREF